jgi:hypothetical protein
MAAQEGAKQKPAAKPEEETEVAEEKFRPKPTEGLTETQEAFAAFQAEAERERQARVETEKALTDARDVLEATQAEVEREHQARVKAEKELTKTQEALEATEAEVKKEQQARAKAEQARAEAEAEKTELPPTAPGEEGTEQPVSFIVRLTVDERGKPLRTEIQPGQRDKEPGKFLGLNGQELATYMEKYISPPSPAEVEAPMPEPPTPTTGLTVSDVRVFRAGVPGVTALALSPGGAFMVQARFQLQGPETSSLTAQEPSFQVQVYAREVISGGPSNMLTTYEANLVEDVLEYTPLVQVPGLSPGLYRLITVVELQAPITMRGRYEGPIVEVIGLQSSGNPVTSLEVPMSL